MWDDPQARQARRVDLIRAWFRDPDRSGGPGMELMSWESRMPVEEWWGTVLDMVRLAPDDRCLGAVAAGPLEGLLSRHGAEVIDRVEAEASADAKFLTSLRSVWQCGMTDEVWERVQAIQASLPSNSVRKALSMNDADRCSKRWSSGES